MLRRATAMLVLALLSLAGAAGAQLKLPPPQGYVNDFANVISPEYEARIQAIVDEVRQKSGGEIVVVTLPSLQGRSEAEVALQIGREWGVGKKGEAGDATRNTGTVVLVAPTEHKVRVELGYQTNTFITAAESGRIQDEHMVPAFRAGNYGQGILEGVTAIAQAYAQQFKFQLTGAGAAAPAGEPQVQYQPQPSGRRRPGRGGISPKLI
ncbi:MAG TPA: TPM domain-containing protein, partial [Longimicrobiaceae bacterium]|nr:TPM domain-containing protein [Longimicrobiaceae bacterium]